LDAFLKWVLIGDVEALIFPGKILPADIDIFNDRQIGSFLTPLQYSINGFLAALKHGFDRAVRPISNPAQNARPLRSALCFHSKKNALNPSENDDVGTYLFLHANLTNVLLESYEARKLEG
jgi:hypothetical protein